jgi:type VI protein secretion system component Hcp
MASRSSASYVGWCLALLLGGALAQANAQAPQTDLSGAWGSNIGLTYTITQSGSQITWTDSTSVVGTIVSTASGLSTTWSDASGQHSATGTILERDNAGRPTKIAWSNGVVFQRAATFGVQIAKPVYQVAPPAPASPPVQAVPNIQGVHLQGATVFASTMGAPQGTQGLFLSIPGLTDKESDPVSLRSASMRLGLGGQPARIDAGAGHQRADFSPISISKVVDRVSPLLMEAAAKGSHFQTARIGLAVSPVGEVMAWELTQVVVSSYTATADVESGAPRTVEDLTLQFNEIKYIVFNYDKDGNNKTYVQGTFRSADNVKP